MDRYELRITGELGSRRRRALGCDTAARDSGPDAGPHIAGETRLLTGPLDQAGLFGLLASLRDAGIELIALRRITPRHQGDAR